MNDNVLTGNILKHIGSSGKVESLEHYCQKFDCLPSECVAVGDGLSDYDIFNAVGCSIAINADEKLTNIADHSINTDNIMDIINFIL